ncbi:hypothetical protein EC396_17360 [Lutibacter sp. HS1-25]|nr:hypothetical protein EC396_17360 [Lutibacter sp. HS1-25]
MLGTYNPNVTGSSLVPDIKQNPSLKDSDGFFILPLLSLNITEIKGGVKKLVKFCFKGWHKIFSLPIGCY